jgi:hypothetical protein
MGERHRSFVAVSSSMSMRTRRWALWALALIGVVAALVGIGCRAEANLAASTGEAAAIEAPARDFVVTVPVPR